MQICFPAAFSSFPLFDVLLTSRINREMWSGSKQLKGWTQGWWSCLLWGDFCCSSSSGTMFSICMRRRPFRQRRRSQSQKRSWRGKSSSKGSLHRESKNSLHRNFASVCHSTLIPNDDFAFWHAERLVVRNLRWVEVAKRTEWFIVLSCRLNRLPTCCPKSSILSFFYRRHHHYILFLLMIWYIASSICFLLIGMRIVAWSIKESRSLS